MGRIGHLALALLGAAHLAALAPEATAQSAPRLTPERVYAEPNLNGPAARGVQAAPNGLGVSFLRAKADDRNVFDLWLAPLSGEAPRLLVDSRALAPKEEALSEEEKARRERMRIASLRGIVQYSWSSDGASVLIPIAGDVFLANASTGAAEQLTKTPRFEIDARLAPNGKTLSYVRDGNLYAFDVAARREKALTKDGAGPVFYGLAEFMAQEEMDRDQGYWWSPDSARIAFTRVDEAGVDIVPRLDIGADGARIVDQRYPRAGRPNAKVSVQIADVANGKTITVPIAGADAEYIARVNWSRSGDAVFIQTQNRAQTRLVLHRFTLADRSLKTILVEESPHWVELNHDFSALADGGFLWTSERTGFRHIYHYGPDGALKRQITSGDWPVAAIISVDEKADQILFTGWRDSPLERHVFMAALREQREPRQITRRAGWWEANAPLGLDYMIASFSSPDQPPQTGVFALKDGAPHVWIEENALRASDNGGTAHPFAAFAADAPGPSYGAIKGPGGETLYWQMLKPRGFDPAKKYPAILSVYGGPHVQHVRRTWVDVRDRILADAGYVVFRLDNRGSANRGKAFETAIHGRMGEREVEDQVAGVNYLKEQGFIDPTRVGVMGWSYGGYMTLRLLTLAPDAFAAGASGAPVSDWALYDTHYTERYMRHPQDNPDGYRASAVPANLKDLKAKLLLIHGMADDNVILEHSTRVLSELQSRSIPFETMLYPGERHGIQGNARGLHLWRTYLDFFARHLRPEPVVASD